MTYDEALQEAAAKGSVHCSGPALMAQTLAANAQDWLGAVSPRLMWEGAQRRGLTTEQVVAMCATDRPPPRS